MRIDMAEYGHEEGQKRAKARQAEWLGRCIRFERIDQAGKSELIVRPGVDTSDCN
jgi:hypothetical protein